MANSDLRIAEIDIRCCRYDAVTITRESLRGGAQAGMEFLVVTLRTEERIEASCFGYAGRTARGAGEIAAASLRPFFKGRSVLDRERAWQDFRTVDRWWHHTPIWSYGPFDAACWILAAQAAGQPLYRYIGGARGEVPTYVRSLVLPTAEDYGREAAEAKVAGFAAYKLHPPGRDFDEDLAAHEAAREAVGDRFTLMSDPVASLDLDAAVRLGRRLEQLGYLWLEEPLWDESFHALRELTRILDIPVVGCEVLAKHPYSVAECISTRVVDRVRADVSWTGGVTGVIKTARLAESFGVNCEIHTAILHPLELVNLHCCAAIANCAYFELLTPLEPFAFGLAEPLPVTDGVARLPDGPGLGIAFDWDLIDNCTYKTL